MTRFLVTFSGLLSVKTVRLLDGILDMDIPLLFTANPIPDPSPGPEQHDIK